MKKFFVKTTLIALALSVVACSATPVRRSMKETWNDSLTASKIRYKLMRDSEVSKSRTHVEVFRGQVTLTGRSTTDAEKARAETIAKSVKRVTGVENYVHIVGGSDTAVAKAPVTGVPVVATSSKVKTTPTPAIKEKTIVADKAKVTPDDEIATLPTIRESTGKPAVVKAAPVVASRKAVASKVAVPAAKNAKNTQLAKGKSVKPEKSVAKVNKAVAPVTTAKVKAPVVDRELASAIKQSSVKDVTPAAIQSKLPAAKVVGQSKTGLPWDGEVYEDDATRISSSTKATSAATAVRTPAVAPASVSAPAAVASPAPSTGDDLAKEAAQELEKLRQKK